MSSETINALLVSKANLKGPCYAQKFSQQMLERAKSATSMHLKQNRSQGSADNSEEHVISLA